MCIRSRMPLSRWPPGGHQFIIPTPTMNILELLNDRWGNRAPCLSPGSWLQTAFFAALLAGTVAQAEPISPAPAAPTRKDGSGELPKPLPDHPGHVFLEGERVCIPLPPALTPACTQWRLLDDRQQALRSGALPADATNPIAPLCLNDLGVGWYRLEFGSTNQPDLSWTTLAVLRPLQARTPEDSPIAVDSAAAWF